MNSTRLDPDNPTHARFFIADESGDRRGSDGLTYRLRSSAERDQHDRESAKHKRQTDAVAKQLNQKPTENHFRKQQLEHEAKTKSALTHPADIAAHKTAAKVMASLANKKDAEIAAEKTRKDRATDPLYQRVQESASALTRSANALYPHLDSPELVHRAAGIAQSNVPPAEMSKLYWATITEIEEQNLIGERAAATAAQIEANRATMEAANAAVRLERKEQSLREAQDNA
jgi:hypothetical protein